MSFRAIGDCRCAGWLAVAGLAVGALLTGCGTPGAPQPPSLKLPDRATDLTAVRGGNTVTLRWTTPRKNTDRLLIKTPVKATICRQEGSGACQAAGEATVEAGAEGEFRDLLPAALDSGEPRPLNYFVELKNAKGRSAGRSNPAVILAGKAPEHIAGLSAEVRADGVALHWDGRETTLVRLHRRLLTPAPKGHSGKTQKAGALAPAPEAEKRDLLVDPSMGGNASGALDRTARFGEAYEYTAQRLIRAAAGGYGGSSELELAGEVSAPIRVDVVDTFPPAVPQELVAVFVPEEKTVDLSWQPDTDEDLAGYIVYRTEGEGGSWERISGAQPLTGAAFRDAAVTAAHSYRYAVSAIDLTGHESSRSGEATESIPEPAPNQ